MTEDEVNIHCREWLISKGYKYKGILNEKALYHNTQKGRLIDNTKGQLTEPNVIHTNYNNKDNGFGQVPVPDGTRSVLIDHQGFRDDIPDLVWIEAKGSGLNLSALLEGFIRVNYAVYEGGGRGYLATPHKEFELLLERREFLEAVSRSTNGKGIMGLLDAEGGMSIEF